MAKQNKKISTKSKEKYVKKRYKQLLDMGIEPESILGRADDISSFWKNRRNYETFKKRATELVKTKKNDKKTIINKIENKTKKEISKIDKTKFTPIKGVKGAIFQTDFIERLTIADLRAKAYIEELSKMKYDEDTKYYLENYSGILENYNTNLKDYNFKQANKRLKFLESYNIDIVEQTIQQDRDFLQNIFTGGKMAIIDARLLNELKKTIQATTVKQLNQLYKEYSREQIIEDYQEWRMLDNPVYSMTDLENKARWFIGKLNGK